MTTFKYGPPAPFEAPAPFVRDLDARTRDRLMVLLALPSGLLLAVLVTSTLRQRSHALS